MPVSRFRVDWVLVQELAIGPAPRAERHLERLAAEGVRGVLSLCGVEEAPPPGGLEQRFAYRRVVLPDHRAGRMPVAEELGQALDALAQLRKEGPVFVHCLAAMERSPLVCLAWLVHQRGLSPQRALDYMMQVHPGTSPLPGQLELLETITRPPLT